MRALRKGGVLVVWKLGRLGPATLTWRGSQQIAPPSPELGERQHQAHQVRLPRDGVLLVDLLQVPVDGGFRMPRRIGHVADAIAFRQPRPPP